MRWRVNLGQLRTLLRTFLATSDDDPLFTAARLNLALQSSYDALVSDAMRTSRAYFAAFKVLSPDTPGGHNYGFATSPANLLIDFASWLEVRDTDPDGTPLDEVRFEELRDAGTHCFALTGPDIGAYLTTSPDTPAGIPIFLRYAAWPSEITDDSDVPNALPPRFHDVIALDALFVFGLGGEQNRPPELRERWSDRKAQMQAHIGQRGVQPSRTRMVQHDD